MSNPTISIIAFVAAFATITGCSEHPGDSIDSRTDTGLSLDNWTYIAADSLRERRAFGVAMGDFTADGFAEIASGPYIYINPGGDMTGRWDRVTVPEKIDLLLELDVDDDAYPDLIGGACNEQYWLEAMDNTGKEWNVVQIASLSICGHRMSTQGYALAQLEGGGKPEILLAGDSLYYLVIPDEPTSGTWSHKVISTTGFAYATGDIDGDGLIDVAGSVNVDTEEPIAPGTSNQRWNNKELRWWRNPGDGSQFWAWSKINLSSTPDRFELADFTGDDRLDLVVTEERWWGLVPNSNMVVFRGPDDPTSEWHPDTIVTQYSMNNLDAADIDLDGDMDLATNEHRMPRDDMKLEEIERTQIWENDGQGHFTAHEIDIGKESHLGSQLYDLDGDGDLDMVSIAWRHPEMLHIWRNDAIRDGRRK
jgi:hypothetical protein